MSGSRFSSRSSSPSLSWKVLTYSSASASHLKETVESSSSANSSTISAWLSGPASRVSSSKLRRSVSMRPSLEATYSSVTVMLASIKRPSSIAAPIISAGSSWPSIVTLMSSR